MNLRSFLFTACFCMAFIACNAPDQFKSRGPIVLGDSSTIVTETDSQYLRDMVADFQPVVPQPQPEPTPQEAPPTPDTPIAAQAAATAAAIPAKGLEVDFDEIKVFIADIETTSFSYSASNKKNAAYMLTGGSLAGNKLQFSGEGTITRVNQRYETALAIEGKSEPLVLESLAKTSGWQTLKVHKDEVILSGLEAAKLQYFKASQSRIRTEVTKVARAKRLNRQEQQEYLNAVKKVRAANQKPMTVLLRYVTWQISGKDSKGRAFTKELRIDMPG